MADHPPAKARALVQQAKAGKRPIAELLGEARAIADPSFAAEALAALAEDPRLDVPMAGRALVEAAQLVGRAERAFRKAEAGAEVARRAARWRAGEEEAAVHRIRALDALAHVAQTLHGKDLAALATAVAKAGPAQRAAMLKLVLNHGADPVEDAKAVLKEGAGPGVAEALVQAPAALRPRLLAYHRAHGGDVPLGQALDAAAGLGPDERRETLRAIIAASRTQDLATIHAALPAAPADAAERGRLLCALAAQADRTGDDQQAAAWFDEAAAVAATLAGKERDAVLRNVEAGRARLGGAKPMHAKPAGKPSETKPIQSADVGAPVRTPAAAKTASNPSGRRPARHVLALVDAYEGSLGDVHLRAIGRAAPLCWAFGLDLGLVGFPAVDLAQLAPKVAKSTGIGEGGDHFGQLVAQGRVHVLPATVSELPGFAVATTPKPDARKSGDFAAASATSGGSALVVLVGLGPKGLPGELMRAAPVHLELTGDNVSLETATAMGVIAERMRQLPVPKPSA